MTPYGAKPAYRTRVLRGIAPWSRATMAALLYWCVLSTVLVSAHPANADIEFYPDFSRPTREDLRFLENDRSGAPSVQLANRSPNSRQVPQTVGASETAPAPSTDIDESTQRQHQFNADSLGFDQRHTSDLNTAYIEKFEQVNEMFRREEELRRQRLRDEAVRQMAGQQALLHQFVRELKNDPDRQQMQVRHRPNYPEISMEKSSQDIHPLSDPSSYYYADLRIRDFLSPPSNYRQSEDTPSLRDLTAMADTDLLEGDDLSMDGGADSPDASGDVQHVLQYYGGAVPAGLPPQTSRNAPLPPPREQMHPQPHPHPHPVAASPPPPANAPMTPPRSNFRSQSYNSNTMQMEDGTVVKKVLRMPDHWFLGMPDVYKLAIVIGCSVLGAACVIGGLIWQYKLHRRAKAAADVDYPAYGVTGPSRDLSPSGDRRLAQSAQIYHYQHQKQQILSMEGGNQPASRGSMSEAESEDENEEGDYTVYECPGLAPPGEMEVKNPMFDDDPTTATPATPATPGSTTVGQAEGQTKSTSTRKGSPSSK